MAQAIDPVCGMTVDTETAKHTSQYGGSTYYFCAPGCKAAFDREPTKYLSGTQSQQGEHGSHEDHTGHSH